MVPLEAKHTTKTDRKLVGTDVYVFAKEKASPFVKKLTSLNPSPFRLQLITNRGAKIWPEGIPETFCTEQWRCRFVHKDKNAAVHFHDITTLLENLSKSGYDIIKVENLYTYDGAPGYSSADVE
jgi:isocitrate dehydrogenase